MSSAKQPEQVAPPEVKQCCARLYESDAAKLLLGDSFHPGGLKLTERLGRLLPLELPKELDGLLAWVSCVADAQPIEHYIHYLRSAGLAVQATELQDEALLEMVRQVQGRLLAADVMAGLNKIELPGFNLTEAKHLVKAALAAIQSGQLGYAIITAEKLMIEVR